MASGSSSAHSKWRRPGKSNRVTALAVSMPTRATPAATLRHRTMEVPVYSGSTVCSIWPSTCADTASNCSHDSARASTGRVRHSANTISGNWSRRRGMGEVSG